MADEAKLPTEEEIAQLPRWARVAFAARCARRAFSVFRQKRTKAKLKHVLAIERAILAAETTAACEVRAIEFTTKSTERAVGRAVRGLTWSIARAAGNTAHTAFRIARSKDASAAAVVDVIRLASHAGVATSVILADYHRLDEESRRLSWTDNSPVPPTVFDSPSPPAGSDPAVASLFIALGSQGDEQAGKIGDALVRVWEAANEYHMARGGGVLTFDEFKQMIPALVPVGPEVEG